MCEFEISFPELCTKLSGTWKSTFPEMLTLIQPVTAVSQNPASCICPARVCFLSVSAPTFRISCRTTGSSQIRALPLWVLRQAFASFCAWCSQTSASLKRLPLGCVRRLTPQSQEEADTESLLALKGSQIHPSYTVATDFHAAPVLGNSS